MREFRWSSEVERQYRDHGIRSLVTLTKFAGFGSSEESAQGMFITDDQGRNWLDFAGGYGVFNMGHRHPSIVAAVRKQLDTMPLSAKVFFNPVQAALMERLAGILPGGLKKSFFANSGTEAVEGALKLARLHTGRPGFVSAHGAFHGKSFGSLSISGRDLYRTPFEPLLPGCTRVPFGDSGALSQAVNDQTAAIILEPIQGEGGIIVPPIGYLREAARIAHNAGALLIVDEVQTGFGRTGANFACQHEDVHPDIIVLGKALGGGVMPVAAFVGTSEVWAAFEKDPTIHTTTFGGNPLACAAALAAIDVLLEEELAARARDMGELLLLSLIGLAAAKPAVIKEVRGQGLLIGVELTDQKYGGMILGEMAKRRIIAVYTLNQPKVIRFEPPLIVEEGHIDQAVTAFAESVAVAESKLRSISRV